jgi:hypothetical protein
MAVVEVRERLLEALGFLLEPVILLLLKNGITWNEFADVAKTKFVEVATRRFGIRGRPTNISRVAILTGQDRREVSRIRRAMERATGPRPLFKPTQVLDGWYRDPEFLDADGKPRDLELEGEHGSFSQLSRRYAPSIPHIAMIKQLRAVGAVADLDNGQVRVLKRAYVPRALSADHIALWGGVLHDMGTTWEYNLMRDAATERSRFERRAVNLRVDVKALPEFQAFLEAEGQAFLERVDDWLSEHQVSPETAADARSMRLGVGVYHIGDDKLATRRRK